MRRRLYFTLPDIQTTREIANDLLLAHIENRHMHIMAKEGIPLQGLHEASVLQKSDFIHGIESGLTIGGIAGIVAGLAALLFPPAGVDLRLVTLLVTALIGAAFGAWASSMIASSVPNSKLRSYEQAIAEGRILMMVDVPSGRVDEIRQLVASRHPEAGSSNIEPTIPAFP